MPTDVASNSQLRCFKRCKRKYWLQYVRGLKKRRSSYTGARQLGTRVHGALQHYYTDHDPASAFAYLNGLRAQEEERSVGNDAVLGDIAKEHDLAVAMVEGFFQWLAEDAADLDLYITAAEKVIRTPSPVAGIDLIGKLDLHAHKLSTGDEGFVDFKTVGDLQGPLKYLGTDEQFRQYALMQRLMSLEDGVEPVRFQIYRMLKRSKRTARAKPPFFADYYVYINEEELRAMWTRLAGEIADLVVFETRIEAAPEQHRSIAYPNPTMDCSWSCDFYSVCPMFDDARSDPEYLISMNYDRGNPHDYYEGQLASGADNGE